MRKITYDESYGDYYKLGSRAAFKKSQLTKGLESLIVNLISEVATTPELKLAKRDTLIAIEKIIRPYLERWDRLK